MGSLRKYVRLLWVPCWLEIYGGRHANKVTNLTRYPRLPTEQSSLLSDLTPEDNFIPKALNELLADLLAPG